MNASLIWTNVQRPQLCVRGSIPMEDMLKTVQQGKTDINS